MNQDSPQACIETNDVLNILKQKIDLENQENKKKIANLEDQINKYKSLISTYEDKIKCYEQDQEKKSDSTTTPGKENPQKDIKIIKIQEQNINGINLDTQILTNKNERKFLRNIMLNEENKIFKTQLLYRMSKDGFSFESFHDKVDFISPLIVILETESGRKFGVTTKKFFKPLKFIKNEKNDQNNKLKSFCFYFNTFNHNINDDEIAFEDYKEEKSKNDKTDFISFASTFLCFLNDMKKCSYYNNEQIRKHINIKWGPFTFSIRDFDSKNENEFKVKEIEVFTYNIE